MNILLCPDKFKGSLSALEVCNSLSKGLLSVDNKLQILKHPMADGGDGSIEILKTYFNLVKVNVNTVDPLGRNIEAEYYHAEDIAFIELASASGIVLLAEAERNPLMTSTRGTGEMIKDAIERGFQKILLFIGGSATNDGGIGIANALGFDFLDKNGKPLEPTGINLWKINRIENNSQYDFKNIGITALCDVTNPMFGPNGAAHVYGAQKGASPKDILTLDKGLRNYNHILRSQLQCNLADLPGIGAAGAVGASLVGMLNASLENGFQLLSDITHLEEAVKNADIVITGEGKIDQTSFQGKVVGNVVEICKKYNIPCGIVCGTIDEIKGVDFKFEKSIISLAKDIHEAMTFPEKFLVEIGKDIGSHL